MKSLISKLAIVCTFGALVFTSTQAEAHPVCAYSGCFQRAGYSVLTDFDYIGYDQITNWNVNYKRTHIQTKVGDIVLYADGHVTSTNKDGDTISGYFFFDEYNNYVMYFDGWSKPVVIVNPIFGE